MVFDLRSFADRVISQYVYGQDAAPQSLSLPEAERLIRDRSLKHRLNSAGRVCR